MCLDTISKQKFRYKKENGYNIGWKVFDNINYHLHFRHMGNDNRIPIGKWINEIDYRQCLSTSRIWMYARKSYQAGFHIYLDEPEHWHDRRKVYFRKVVAYGKEGDTKVIVAKEMFVVSKRKK